MSSRVTSAHLRPIVVALLVFAAALSIRVVGIGSKSLWGDEGATFAFAQESVSEILDVQDTHPPGYYLLIHAVTRLSASETALRLPSALASAAGAALIYLIGARLFGPAVGIGAGVLAVVSPLDVWYAQDARHAALAAFFVLLAFYPLMHTTPWSGALSALALSLGLFVDYIVLIGWTGIGGAYAVYWWNRDRRRVRQFGVVSVVPLALFFAIYGASLEDAMSTLTTYDADWYRYLFAMPGFGSGLAVALVTFALSVAVSWVMARLLARPVWPWLALVGFAALILLIPVPRAYSIEKIMVIGWPLLLLTTSWLIVNRVPRQARPATAALVSASVVATAINLFVIEKEDWRSVTAAINARSEHADMAWVGDLPWSADAYNYYGGRLPVSGVSDPEPVVQTAQPEGVWLVASRAPRDEAPSLLAEAWFDENWQLIEEQAFYRLVLKHYRPPPELPP